MVLVNVEKYSSGFRLPPVSEGWGMCGCRIPA